MKYATGLFLIATSGVSAFAPSSQTFIPAKIGEARRSQVSRFMADDEAVSYTHLTLPTILRV